MELETSGLITAEFANLGDRFCSFLAGEYKTFATRKVSISLGSEAVNTAECDPRVPGVWSTASTNYGAAQGEADT